MGIGRFFRWMAERYPRINEYVTPDAIPEFDCLYLDMNGIIHNCSHANTGGCLMETEEDIWVEVFRYINQLFHIIKPHKLLYMAVDGVAPRAKMNQQRSRRFRAANDAREARLKEQEMAAQGVKKPSSGGNSMKFDSNCITPGTEFMSRLCEHLKFFVYKKMTEDPLWRDVEVILSGPDVPGEGEHKIMDYIRKAKAQAGYDPNTRHCLYGLDADLIMLSLASHEPHFALLREEIVFGTKKSKDTQDRVMTKRDIFQLLHISLVREYLDLEMRPSAELEATLPFHYDKERVVDDFIIFCYLVGNDFLPHLASAEIGEGGLTQLMNAYREHLHEWKEPKEPWLSRSCGEVAWENLLLFFQRWVPVEMEMLADQVADEEWMAGKRRVCGREDDGQQTHPQGPEWNRPMNIDDAVMKFYKRKLGFDTTTDEGKRDRDQLVHTYLQGLQWVLFYYYRGPPSWSWYYPYHYPPYVRCLAEYAPLRDGTLRIDFDVGEPFFPFEQLMSVMPSTNSGLLPKVYRPLMEDPRSPIASFYPREFEIDMDGVKVPWGGAALIPFIDERKLLREMKRVVSQAVGSFQLSEEEKKRNGRGVKLIFRYDRRNPPQHVSSTLLTKFPSIRKCKVSATIYTHPAFPPGVEVFPNRPLEGCEVPWPGFPTLHVFPLTSELGSGVKVFNFEARDLSLILNIRPPPVTRDRLVQLLSAYTVQIEYPFVHIAALVRLIIPGYHDVIVRKDLLSEGENLRGPMNLHLRDPKRVKEKLREVGVELADEVEEAEGSEQIDVVKTLGLSAKGRQKDNEDEDEVTPASVVCEVLPVDEIWKDEDGGRHYRFSKESKFQLLPLVDVFEETAPPPLGSRWQKREVQDRYPLDSEVMCIQEGEAFGAIGRVTKTHPCKLEEVEAEFELDLLSGASASSSAEAVDDKEILQKAVRVVMEEEQKAVRWYTLAQLERMLRIPSVSLEKLLGSVRIRIQREGEKGAVYEDMGMGLMALVGPKGKERPMCVPGYSAVLFENNPEGPWFVSSELRKEYEKEKAKPPSADMKGLRTFVFSDLAVAALREYQELFPDFVKVVSNRRGEDRPIAAIAIFPNSPDAIFSADQMVSWVNRQPYKTLKLVMPGYKAVTSKAIRAVAMLTNAVAERKAGETGVMKRVVLKGAQDFWRAEETVRALPKRIADKNAERLTLGERVVFVKQKGLAPVGSVGTVVGVYGDDRKRDTVVEVLLDEPVLGGSDLRGRCPVMRGLQVPPSHVLRLAVLPSASASKGQSHQGSRRESRQNSIRGGGKEKRDPKDPHQPALPEDPLLPPAVPVLEEIVPRDKHGTVLLQASKMNKKGAERNSNADAIQIPTDLSDLSWISAFFHEDNIHTSASSSSHHSHTPHKHQQEHSAHPHQPQTIQVYQPKQPKVLQRGHAQNSTPLRPTPAHAGADKHTPLIAAKPQQHHPHEDGWQNRPFHGGTHTQRPPLVLHPPAATPHAAAHSAAADKQTESAASSHFQNLLSNMHRGGAPNGHASHPRVLAPPSHHANGTANTSTSQQPPGGLVEESGKPARSAASQKLMELMMKNKTKGPAAAGGGGSDQIGTRSGPPLLPESGGANRGGAGPLPLRGQNPTNPSSASHSLTPLQSGVGGSTAAAAAGAGAMSATAPEFVPGGAGGGQHPPEGRSHSGGGGGGGDLERLFKNSSGAPLLSLGGGGNQGTHPPGPPSSSSSYLQQNGPSSSSSSRLAKQQPPLRAFPGDPLPPTPSAASSHPPVPAGGTAGRTNPSAPAPLLPEVLKPPISSQAGGQRQIGAPPAPSQAQAAVPAGPSASAGGGGSANPHLANFLNLVKNMPAKGQQHLPGGGGRGGLPPQTVTGGPDAGGGVPPFSHPNGLLPYPPQQQAAGNNYPSYGQGGGALLPLYGGGVGGPMGAAPNGGLGPGAYGDPLLLLPPHHQQTHHAGAWRPQYPQTQQQQQQYDYGHYGGGQANGRGGYQHHR